MPDFSKNRHFAKKRLIYTPILDYNMLSLTRTFMSRSSRGLGHRPFTAATRVRIPYGMPFSSFIFNQTLRLFLAFHQGKQA